MTQAVRLLNREEVQFKNHSYPYVAGGGTAQSAEVIGVDEHLVIKTLIMESEKGEPMIVLMHGDRQVSTKALARCIGTKSLHPCLPKIADKHSGYQVGGTSPFGTRRKMPVYCQRTVVDLPLIYINGGRRGFIISMAPGELQRVLKPILVEIAC